MVMDRMDLWVFRLFEQKHIGQMDYQYSRSDTDTIQCD